MPRVVWTDEAETQLAVVGSDDTGSGPGGGLRPISRAGWRIPELRESPECDILREVVLPHEARMIYLFVPDSNEGIILGLFTKGRRLGRDRTKCVFQHGDSHRSK